MEQEKVLQFLSINKDYFMDDETTDNKEIVDALLKMPESDLVNIMNFPFRKPTIVKAMALFWMDRAYLGDYRKSILKAITWGGLFVWWVKDVKSAKTRAREYNRKQLVMAASNPTYAKEQIEKKLRNRKIFAIIFAILPALKDGVKGIQDGMYVN